MRKMPQRMKKVSCLVRASLSSSRFPSLYANKQTSVKTTVDLMSLPVLRPACLPHGFGHVSELHKVVLPQQLMSRHVTLKKKQQGQFERGFLSCYCFFSFFYQKHFDWQQVDENHPLVLLAGSMAVIERVGQEFLSCNDTSPFKINMMI